MTIESVDISKYPDFGLYEKLWFKDNHGIYNSEPGRWLHISKCTGRLMCYHILTQTGKYIYISTIQRVINLELSTDKVKETFVKFDAKKHQQLKAYTVYMKDSN